MAQSPSEWDASQGRPLSVVSAPSLWNELRLSGSFPKLTARQKVKLFERVRKEPEHFLQSEGFRAFEADRVLQEKMKHKLIKKASKRWMKGKDRNAPCPCGSGKKYKKCHG